ncbi:MAG TPA: thiamine pyrophosphate-dependent enzyme [Ignavibacteria bacterium]|nr:thiamine pyrophosphate-dependent enzyme [Ignavibacteria bacterium]
MKKQTKLSLNGKTSFGEYKKEVLADYKLANESRQASILGRKEVLTGKAKFGIFGDGKEVAQIAMAKAFQNGDFRSGYYRDQTFAFATGISTVKEFFAQLYADTNVKLEPASAGRSMNGHFANRLLDDKGNWKNLMEMKNTSADISPTASQMIRLVGLAYASKLYRNNEQLHGMTDFSDKGNEVAFGTIGNASCAEGMFFEAINAAGVLMIPMAVSVWDDGYGISVPSKYQITKENISEILKGFEYDEKKDQGYLIYSAKGWDYPELTEMYRDGISQVREKHIPALFHITEVTQPQGHSTSGSHERYKSKERLEWETEYCCIVQMRKWMLANAIGTEEELDAIESDAKDYAKSMQKEAWKDFLDPIKKEQFEVIEMLDRISGDDKIEKEIKAISDKLKRSLDNNRKEISESINTVLRLVRNQKGGSFETVDLLKTWYRNFRIEYNRTYDSHLYSQSEFSAMNVKEVKPVYSSDSKTLDGREVLNAFFDIAFDRDPRIFAIGEDLGKLGDVNQGMAGLQEKYSELRLTDTGIREATIAGQGIGTALRGLRPIIEIQYLDYLFYALQILSDDLACLQYRTAGGQKAPLIIRTRGHRLEGIWHSGSPMGTIINSVRGIHVCVPRDMTRAAGFYNTILKSDEPAIIIERLNAYRLKEDLPDNLGEVCVPLGVPEILAEGNDITIVTYGACVDIARDAVSKLAGVNISCELIDVQTLLPFDINGMIAESLKKTNRILFLDEDVPGGASAFMMQNVIDRDGGYRYLDSPPKCLAAKEHRPAYGTDGDYFSKPNAEEIFETVYDIMHEADPGQYPDFL